MSREAMINLLGGFFPEYYLQSNEDIRNVIGTDQQNAWRHYLEHGIEEERRPNPFFDPKFYREFHSDLSTMNGKQLLDHWIKHGLKEGRRGCEDFWIMFYLKSHEDLVRAFGSDLGAAFDHWKTHGNAEARRTAPSRVLRIYCRNAGETIEIVVRTGAEGADPALFELFSNTGGQIEFGQGLVIGTYRGDPDFSPVSGVRIGYGLDRVATRISNEITGAFWRHIGRLPIDQVLDECVDNVRGDSTPTIPRITFANLKMRPSTAATAPEQPSC
jgi:hypothetical protein